MVPKGWSEYCLADIVKEKISYGIVQAGPHIEDGIPYIKSSDVKRVINLDALQRTSHEIHFKYRRSAVHPGDIVFSLRGNIGESAIVPNNLLEANLTQGTARISIGSNQYNIFHYYQLQSESFINRINSLSKGSTFKEISLEELRKVKVLSPPFAEQQKIAQILSTWDQAIAVTESLLENSQQQKKALMQQLLTGKKRLLDENGVRFGGEWAFGNLSDIANISKGKALSSKHLELGDYPVIAGGKTSPYTHSAYTHENVITISASGAYAGYVAFYPYKIWASDCSVVLNKANTDIKYIYHLLVYMQETIYSLQSGGAQPHVYPKDLESLKVKIPTQQEQEKIAKVLSTADQEIQALQQKIDCLKQEKKALMQQLLTGKRRVKVAA